MTKKIKKNKAVFYILALIILIAIGLFLKKQQSTTEVPQNIENWMKEQAESKTQISSMSTKDVKGENFSGKVAVVTGDSILAKSAEGYIEKTVAEFKKQADIDVPDMRSKFGADSPTANYTIDIQASQMSSKKTKSIVLSEYMYTGGANGNGLYKVFTASEESGSLLSLGDIIKKDKQVEFVNLLKKELKSWVPEGAEGPIVFTEEVDGLTFKDFSNWSMDDKNLTIYFDKYAIGPGVLGPVAFPIKLSKLKDFLK